MRFGNTRYGVPAIPKATGNSRIRFTRQTPPAILLKIGIVFLLCAVAAGAIGTGYSGADIAGQ